MGPGVRLWKLEKARAQIFPENLWKEHRSAPALVAAHFGIWPPGLQDRRRINWCHLSYEDCGDLSQQPQKTNMVC